MLFDPKKLLVIAGPCSLENECVCRAVAETLVKIGRANRSIKFVFKGSFDKANRTSLAGERCTGIDEGPAPLALVKKDYGFPVLTERSSFCRSSFSGSISSVPLRSISSCSRALVMPLVPMV